MGIRVDKRALLKQLQIEGCEDRRELIFHKALLNDELPLSIGGGIGQSLTLYVLFALRPHRRGSSVDLAAGDGPRMRGWRRLPSLVDLIDVPLISRQLRCECVGDFFSRASRRRTRKETVVGLAPLFRSKDFDNRNAFSLASIGKLARTSLNMLLLKCEREILGGALCYRSRLG